MKKMIIGVMGASLLAASAMAGAAAPGQTGTPAAQPASTAAAPEAGSKFHDAFAKLDSNHDGAIDKAEAKADKMLSKSFAKVAKKGKLTEEQYAKWAGAHQKGAAKPKG